MSLRGELKKIGSKSQNNETNSRLKQTTENSFLSNIFWHSELQRKTHWSIFQVFSIITAFPKLGFEFPIFPPEVKTTFFNLFHFLSNVGWKKNLRQIDSAGLVNSKVMSTQWFSIQGWWMLFLISTLRMSTPQSSDSQASRFRDLGAVQIY